MKRLLLLAVIAAIVGTTGALDGQSYQLRLRQTLPPSPMAPPDPLRAVDLGGYRPQIPASHGGNTTGGCRVGAGGVPRIVRINSLADTETLSGILSGSGTANDPYIHTATLRGALLATWPRCIVVEVSGYITIDGTVNILSPYFTLAGQTAPAPGITIRASATALPSVTTERAIYVATHDTVFQHVRIRPGDSSCNSALQYYNFDNPANIVDNGLLDHVSVSWAQDEGVFFNYAAPNFMIWRSIVAEILANTPNTQKCPGGSTSMGHGIGIGQNDGIAILQNVIAHNEERNPQADGGSSGAIQNNVYYGVGIATWFYSITGSAIAWRWDGNYIKRDSNATTRRTGVLTDAQPASSQVYFANNVFDNGMVSPVHTEFHVRSGSDPRVGAPPGKTTVSNYVTKSASETYNYVLDRAGARPLSRDAVDTRIMTDVRNRTGAQSLATIASVGGYPTLAQNRQAYTIPANPFSVAAGQTFRTNIEMDLEAKAAALEPPE